MKDVNDDFPLDSTEWDDVNGDGLGDNKNQLSTFDEFKQSPTLPIVMIVLILAIMVLLYRRDPNPGLSNLVQTPPEETPPPENKENEVEAHSLDKNECRMDKHGKVICPACNSKLGVPDGSVPPFKFTCPKCENKIRVVPTEKF